MSSIEALSRCSYTTSVKVQVRWHDKLLVFNSFQSNTNSNTFPEQTGVFNNQRCSYHLTAVAVHLVWLLFSEQTDDLSCRFYHGTVTVAVQHAARWSGDIQDCAWMKLASAAHDMYKHITLLSSFINSSLSISNLILMVQLCGIHQTSFTTQTTHSLTYIYLVHHFTQPISFDLVYFKPNHKILSAQTSFCCT